MRDCAAISDDDIAKLTKMGQAFEHPIRLIIDGGHNLIVNGIPVFKDIMVGVKDLNSAKYEQAGKEFGQVAAMVLWGAENQELFFSQ